MSSPASRRKQRQRRRARQSLWQVQSLLESRVADLAAYDRVIADMNRRYQQGDLSPFSGAQAVSVVTVLRDATKSACDKLRADVAAMKRACKQLEPKPEGAPPS